MEEDELPAWLLRDPDEVSITSTATRLMKYVNKLEKEWVLFESLVHYLEANLTQLRD